jgi:sugar fermentation stimulation protein A
MLTVHCPNTGAMTGCSEPGSVVWLSESPNPKRKYTHTLEMVASGSFRVGVNTAQANRLVAEALSDRRLPALAEYATVKAEAAIPDGRGRFDFRLTGMNLPDCYVEVKSMTLYRAGGVGAFPDAVSERALRHVDALVRRKRDGDRAVLLFCVLHTGVEVATTADDVHPAYGERLREAVAEGVEVMAWTCSIERDGMRLAREIPVDEALRRD